jgi:hypothetical protein
VRNAVRLTSIAAQKARKKIVVRWHVASEVDVLGYNVYCGPATNRVRSNKRLILAIGSQLRGHSYSYAEPVGKRHRFGPYWVQAVNQRGAPSWFGPAKVR